jgi:hypothetical protein
MGVINFLSTFTVEFVIIKYSVATAMSLVRHSVVVTQLAKNELNNKIL